jgi:hypothetical protein
MLVSNTKSERKLLSEWYQSNFLGWFLGGFGYIFVVICFSIFYIDATLFTAFFLLLPFGISISIMQWLILRHWKIQVPLLIPSTILGWSISTITILAIVYITNQYTQINFPFAFSTINSPFGFLIVCGAGSLTVGASIGFFQTFSLKKSVSRLDNWILTNAFSYFALVTLEATVFIMPMLWEVEGPSPLLLVFMLIALPFLATLFIAIPTGKILLRYSTPKLENENQVAE